MSNGCNIEVFRSLFRAEGIELGTGGADFDDGDREDSSLDLSATLSLPPAPQGELSLSKEDVSPSYYGDLLRDMVRRCKFAGEERSMNLTASRASIYSVEVLETMELTRALRDAQRSCPDLPASEPSAQSFGSTANRNDSSTSLSSTLRLAESVQDLQATFLAATWHELMNNEGVLRDFSLDAQALLLSSTMYQYGSLAPASLANDMASEVPVPLTLARSASIQTDSFAATSRMTAPAVATEGRTLSSDSESPTSLGSSIRDGDGATMESTSLSRRLAGALAANTISLGGSFGGGIIELLQQLALDGVSFEQSFSESIRRVRNLGTVLSGDRLTTEEIDALPQIPFQDHDPQSCAICLEVYKRGEILTRLPCYHSFHVDCITTWMRRATRCPLCRTDCSD